MIYLLPAIAAAALLALYKFLPIAGFLFLSKFKLPEDFL